MEKYKICKKNYSKFHEKNSSNDVYNLHKNKCKQMKI